MSGLEVLGVAASIIQVADAGLRLSQTIYTYVNSLASADKRLDRIASHVKLTSQVVSDIGELFNQKQTAQLVSKNAVQAAAETAKECEQIFNELESVVSKSKVKKWRFPWKEHELELLGAQLEKLKSVLSLLMNVLMHARMLKQEHAAPERQKIAGLIRAKDEATTKYEELKRIYESTTQGIQTMSINFHQHTEIHTEVPGVGTPEPLLTAFDLDNSVQHIKGLLQGIVAVQQSLNKQKALNNQQSTYNNILHVQRVSALYKHSRAYFDFEIQQLENFQAHGASNQLEKDPEAMVMVMESRGFSRDMKHPTMPFPPPPGIRWTNTKDQQGLFMPPSYQQQERPQVKQEFSQQEPLSQHNADPIKRMPKKGRSIFTPIDESCSIFAQHWAPPTPSMETRQSGTAPSNVDTHFGAAIGAVSGPPNRPQTSMRRPVLRVEIPQESDEESVYSDFSPQWPSSIDASAAQPDEEVVDLDLACEMGLPPSPEGPPPSLPQPNAHKRKVRDWDFPPVSGLELPSPIMFDPGTRVLNSSFKFASPTETLESISVPGKGNDEGEMTDAVSQLLREWTTVY